LIEIGISPIVFTIGSVSVGWYGVMVALAIAVLIIWMVRQTTKTTKLTYEPVLTGALIALPSGIIVSKLFHVFDNIVLAKLHPELVLTGSVIDYTQHPSQIFSPAGLSIYGAIIGGIIGIWIYSKVSKFPYSHVFDLIVPGVILAQAIGRVGCTLNGCCYGVPTSLPWSVVYTHPDSIGFTASVGLPPGWGLHPTQAYEIIFNLIVFGVLLKLRGLKPDGSLALIYLISYSAWRLGIGFLREGTPFIANLQQAQVLGIIVLAITIPLLIRNRRNWAKIAVKE
jgi:phosphatidylglycerol:prolipoprotein diacylglycerol transferase